MFLLVVDIEMSSMQRIKKNAFIFQERERLSALEKRYHTMTGGKSFPKSSTAMREVCELLKLFIYTVKQTQVHFTHLTQSFCFKMQRGFDSQLNFHHVRSF